MQQPQVNLGPLTTPIYPSIVEMVGQQIYANQNMNHARRMFADVCSSNQNIIINAAASIAPILEYLAHDKYQGDINYTIQNDLPGVLGWYIAEQFLSSNYYNQVANRMSQQEAQNLHSASASFKELLGRSWAWCERTNYGYNVGVQQNQIMYQNNQGFQHQQQLMQQHMHHGMSNAPSIGYSNQPQYQPQRNYAAPPTTGIMPSQRHGIMAPATPRQTVYESPSSGLADLRAQAARANTNVTYEEMTFDGIGGNEVKEVTIGGAPIFQMIETKPIEDIDSPSLQVDIANDNYSGDIRLLGRRFPMAFNTETRESVMAWENDNWVMKIVDKKDVPVEMKDHLIPNVVDLGLGRYTPVGDLMTSVKKMENIAVVKVPVDLTPEEKAAQQKEFEENRNKEFRLANIGPVVTASTFKEIFLSLNESANDVKENVDGIFGKFLYTDDLVLSKPSNEFVNALSRLDKIVEVVDALMTHSNDIDSALWTKLDLHYTRLVNKVLKVQMASGIAISSITEDYADLKTELNECGLFDRFNLVSAIQMKRALLPVEDPTVLMAYAGTLGFAANELGEEDYNFDFVNKRKEKLIDTIMETDYTLLPRFVMAVKLGMYLKDLHISDLGTQMMVNEDSHPELHNLMKTMSKDRNDIDSYVILTGDGHVLEFTESDLNRTLFVLVVRKNFNI